MPLARVDESRWPQECLYTLTGYFMARKAAANSELLWSSMLMPTRGLGKYGDVDYAFGNSGLN
jgi:hypothetical protein